MSARALVSKLSPFLAATRSPSLHRFRPIVAAGEVIRRSVSASISGGGIRSFSSRPTTSFLNDPAPNRSHMPPNESFPEKMPDILVSALYFGLDDPSPTWLDFVHFDQWVVRMEDPDPHLTRDEIIDSYVETLAQVVGSEQEARMKICRVSTEGYFSFTAEISKELAYRIRTLPKVAGIFGDACVHVENKVGNGESFIINGVDAMYEFKCNIDWRKNYHRLAEERFARDLERPMNRNRQGESMQNQYAPMMQNQVAKRELQSGPNQPPPVQEQYAPMMQNQPSNRTPPMAKRELQSGPNQPPPVQEQYAPMMQNQPSNRTPPMANRELQSGPNQPPPVQNQSLQIWLNHPQYDGAPSLPMPNREFSPISNRNTLPSQQPPPNVGYPNRMPNPSYQGGSQTYQGQGDGQTAACQGGGPAYHGGNQGYLSGSPGYHGDRPPHRSNNNIYQARSDSV